ncbi:membrane hypothetical protein [Gammaproteobacteria bacterium]
MNSSPDVREGADPFLRTDMPLFVLVRILLPDGRFIIRTTLICTALAVALAFLLPATYLATVVVSPVQNGQQQGGGGLGGQLASLAALGGINLASSNPGVQETIATLKSRAFTDKFIKENEMMPILFAKDWDAERKEWIVRPWKFWKKIPPTPWDAFDMFDKIRTADLDDKTGLVTVGVEWTDPVLAAKWANALVVETNKYLRADAVAKSDRNLNYLKDYAGQASQVEIQKAVSSLVEAELQKAMSANVNEEYSFAVIDRAAVPEKRSKPYRILIILVGFLAGFLLSALWKLMRFFWDRSGLQVAPVVMNVKNNEDIVQSPAENSLNALSENVNLSASSS